MSRADTNTIRLARPADITRIREIDLLATRKFTTIPALSHLSTSAEEEGGVDEETVRRWLVEGQVLVAEATDTGLVGFVACHSLPHTPNATYLAELGVVPECQGQGLGTRLVKAVLETPTENAIGHGRGRAAGPERVMLMTYADVPWNGPWYMRKFGFREVAQQDIEHECGRDMYGIFKTDREKLERAGWRRCLLLWESCGRGDNYNA